MSGDTVSYFMHEINNPLSNIYMLVQALGDMNIDERDTVKEYLNLIQQSTQHVKDLHAEYNEYIKIGKMSINPSVVNLSRVLSSIADEYKLVANKKNVRIVLNVDKEQKRITVDVVKLRQVIGNVISNAVKYNNNGGSVFINCVDNKITISDTGIGMSADELKQIGAPFYRCRRIDAEGTGLGFATVKKITDSLGWELNIKSEVGKGTTVTVSVR